jgi:hypothetical protein
MQQITLLISGSPKLTRLLLLDCAPQEVSHNHLSRLSQPLKFAFPVISCPNLTALIVMARSDIMVTGTNIWKLNVSFLAIQYWHEYLETVTKMLSFYQLGESVKCLMLNDIDDKNNVPENILAVFPSLQTLYLSGVSLRKPAISLIVDKCLI